MMAEIKILIAVLLLITTCQSQSTHNNEINDMDNEIHVETHKEDVNPFVEAAAAFMEGGAGNGADIGSILTNFIQTDGGKTIGNILMGAASQNGGDAATQILSGIGSMLSNNNAGSAIDPSIIGNVLSMMANAGGDTNEKADDQPDLAGNVMSLIGTVLSEQNRAKSNDQFDMGSIMNLVGGFLQNSGENPLSLLASLAENFVGPDAKKREIEHAGHADLLPPLLEKVHIYFDHFKHTELYQALWRVTASEKFMSTFNVDGKFSFPKFFEQLENKSFRRHWIRVITRKITDMIAMVTDPKKQKKYIHTGVTLVNGFLKSVDFPKSTFFDISRPTETLTNLFNYFCKKYLNVPVDAKQYVKPAVKYAEEVIQMAHQRGMFFKDGIDSAGLSHKLTDTINLEIIEPVARVWRAYRFAKKVPECDKYVMCLINQEDTNEVLSLPGLKPSLSKAASMAASWFLSQNSGTSFWTLYSNINDKKDCRVRYLQKCNDFHLEENKVHSEYEHTEL